MASVPQETELSPKVEEPEGEEVERSGWTLVACFLLGIEGFRNFADGVSEHNHAKTLVGVGEVAVAILGYVKSGPVPSDEG